jgi:hypothetical protein
MMFMCTTLLLAGNAPAAVIDVSGNITTNTTWTSDNQYVLNGNVFVVAPAELTIQAGTKIYGDEVTVGSLNINRGAKIHAVGTPTNPIIFTTDRELSGDPNLTRGLWGGVVINGYAPINKCYPTANCTDLDEYYLTNPPANSEWYSFGGTNPNDNSGEFRYVQIKYSGHRFDAEKEWNGLSLHGVGNGTQIDHVQVFMIGDDCIEQFGGTVNMKYMFGLFCDDDGFDWTEGWSGKVQFLVTKNRADVADAGQESDNWEFGHDFLPRSHPVMYNITYVGDPSTSYGTGSTKGMVLRRGTAGEERNIIVTGFKNVGIDVSDAPTIAQANAMQLCVSNGIVFGNNSGGAQYDTDAAALVGNGCWTNLNTVDPLLCKPFDNGLNDICTAAGFAGTVATPCCTGPGKGNCAIKPNFAPRATVSPAINGSIPVATPPADGFFDTTVDFIGAVDPDNDWTHEAWTTVGARQLVGDMTYDNTVNVSDVVKVKRIAAGLQPRQSCADFNLDNAVNVTDIVKVKRTAAGLDPTKVCCTE